MKRFLALLTLVVLPTVSTAQWGIRNGEDPFTGMEAIQSTKTSIDGSLEVVYQCTLEYQMGVLYVKLPEKYSKHYPMNVRIKSTSGKMIPEPEIYDEGHFSWTPASTYYIAEEVGNRNLVFTIQMDITDEKGRVVDRGIIFKFQPNGIQNTKAFKHCN